MKIFKLFSLPLALVLLAFTGCSTTQPGSAAGVTATITLSGAAGTPFSGFYVQDGQRIAVAAVLPWAFHGTGITEFEFRKTNPADTFSYKVVRDGGAGGHSVLAGSIGPGTLGVRGEIRYRSTSISPITPAASHKS